MNKKYKIDIPITFKVSKHMKRKVKKLVKQYDVSDVSTFMRTIIDNADEFIILKKGIKHMTKLYHKNNKYFQYDRDELELLVTMYHDMLEHINVFCMEAQDGQ